MTNVNKMILYMSVAYIGKIHDMAILKEEFGHRKNWFRKFHVLVDLGFKGFEKQFGSLSLSIPYRKKRNQELTDEQKEVNQTISKERVIVEHGISVLKRFSVLRERARNKKWELFDEISGVCAGLSNYTLSP